MDARYEDDLAELHGAGGYLMICADRKRVFLEGATENGVALAECLALRAEDGAIQVEAEGRSIRCPFPEAGAAELEAHVAKLNELLATWR